MMGDLSGLPGHRGPGPRLRACMAGRGLGGSKEEQDWAIDGLGKCASSDQWWLDAGMIALLGGRNVTRYGGSSNESQSGRLAMDDEAQWAVGSVICVRKSCCVSNAPCTAGRSCQVYLW